MTSEANEASWRTPTVDERLTVCIVTVYRRVAAPFGNTPV